MFLDERVREGRLVDQYGMTCETTGGRFDQLLSQVIGRVFSRIGDVPPEEQENDAELLATLCKAFRDWRQA